MERELTVIGSKVFSDVHINSIVINAAMPGIEKPQYGFVYDKFELLGWPTIKVVFSDGTSKCFDEVSFTSVLTKVNHLNLERCSYLDSEFSDSLPEWLKQIFKTAARDRFTPFIAELQSPYVW